MMEPLTTSLDTVQRWMQAVIQHPHGVSDGIAADGAQSSIPLGLDQLESLIPRSTRQTSAQRLQIYADAYFARLLEVLSGEFPALVHAVGAELFAEFALGYLQHSPSRSYTLGKLGAGFPGYLQETRPPRADDQPDWADFLIDCCRLERLYAEVFDGPGPERAPPGELSAALADLDVETFAQSRVVVADWVRLIPLRFPMHEYISAVRRSESPSPPPAAKTWLVVSRRDFVVRRVAVSPIEFSLLQALQAGKLVGEALRGLAELEGMHDMDEALIRHWFSSWTRAGYLRGLRTPAGN